MLGAPSSVKIGNGVYLVGHRLWRDVYIVNRHQAYTSPLLVGRAMCHAGGDDLRFLLGAGKDKISQLLNNRLARAPI